MPDPSKIGLDRGDRLPKIVTPPPGPAARAWCARLAAAEAPGINSLASVDDVNILWREALGANVLDVDGNRYVDLTSGFGVAAIGHRHPRMIQAIHEQADRLVHGLGDATPHPARIELAEQLQRSAPIDEPRIHFAVSGADAVEIAIKTALMATGRHRLLTFSPSYHGLTLGALTASSRQAFRDPFRHHLHDHVVRLDFGADPKEIEHALAAHDIAAVIVEPIVGREGVLLPPARWLTKVNQHAQRAGTLLIVDEIFTGFGRTGRLFAVDHDDVRPDLLCCGKAMAGGMPIGAVIGSETLMRVWETGGEALHTATFVAHPLACRAALEVLRVIDEEDLVARAERLGASMLERLATWPDRYPTYVRTTRGRGLLAGVELHRAEQAYRLTTEARHDGVLMLAGGPNGTVAQLVPPLIITDEQLDDALDRLERILAEADLDERHPSDRLPATPIRG
ncbi:MAG: aspartate aminotransferase family protein [Acidobacteriota bacterium]